MNRLLSVQKVGIFTFTALEYIQDLLRVPRRHIGELVEVNQLVEKVANVLIPDL